MYWLYSLMLVAWGILLLPALLYKAWRRGTYLRGLAQRMGKLPESLRHDGRPTLWFHSCSVGETLSIQPLVQILHRQFPDARFVFSTITPTGQQVASERFAVYGGGNTFYFPIDFASVASRVLDWIRPAMIVIIDTEIWPNTLNQACRRGIPVVLVNGRISAASFRYYRWGRPILRRVFRNYRALLMQSEDDAQRIRQMGAPAEKIAVAGNIKIDRDPPEYESDEAPARQLGEALGLNGLEFPLIVAGSTHGGEESILLEVLQSIRRVPALAHTRLLLAPRHPERFDEVARLAERRGLRVLRRQSVSARDPDAEVLLLDTVGELALAYRFATIAFVGGSLVPLGGHSIMEPALYSKAIVVGPFMQNFRQVAEEFRTQGGLVQISASPDDSGLQKKQLLDVFLRLLQNSEDRERLGKAALSVLERNRGTTQRVSAHVSAVFEEATRK